MANTFERFAVPAAVAVGGAVGSLARWGIGHALPSSPFPTATFVTNLVGSFALGIVLVAGEVIGRHQGHHHRRQRWWVRLWRPMMATGVLGGFTTFSTFVLELTKVQPVVAVVYALASVVLGVVAYTAGNSLARNAFGVRA